MVNSTDDVVSHAKRVLLVKYIMNVLVYWCEEMGTEVRVYGYGCMSAIGLYGCVGACAFGFYECVGIRA